jgi:hypothetical protein
VKRLYLPTELHDKFNDYPLGADMKLPPEEVSPYMEATCPPNKTRGKKLILDLNDKTNYTIHYRNLDYMLKQGYQVEGVDNVLLFDQAKWLKPYVDLMTKKRQAASKAGNKRMVDLYKLLVNSFYGKLCENVLNRPDHRICWSDKQFAQHVKKPTFITHFEFNHDLVGVLYRTMEARVGTLNAAGMAVLELSKLHMQKFHYDTMMDRFGGDNKPDIELMYTDTDSLVYNITYPDATGDAYADMYALREQFDMSGYKDTMPEFLDMTNLKVQGMMKDETADAMIERGQTAKLHDNIIVVFVAVRPKAYAFEIARGTIKKKAKGTDRGVVKSEMFLQDYERVLMESQKVFEEGIVLKDMDKDDALETLDRMQHRRNVAKIGSELHNLYLLQTENRVVLSAYDDKRWWRDAFKSYAYGHHKTQPYM